MSSLGQALGSTVGRKYVMAITGLIWAGFLVTHLLANLLLLAPDGGAAFNLYAHKLAELGPLLWVAEAGLLAAMILHIYNATKITLARRAARGGTKYAVKANAGGKSRKTLASSSMIWTGGLLAFFLIGHIYFFKFGVYYETTVDGVVMRDLKRLVAETFSQLPPVIGYVVFMTVLGVHLRHALWSAFQSLGLGNPRWMAVVEKAGFAFAIVVAGGFLTLPVAIFLGVGQ